MGRAPGHMAEELPPPLPAGLSLRRRENRREKHTNPPNLQVFLSQEEAWASATAPGNPGGGVHKLWSQQDVGHGAARETHQPQRLGNPSSRMGSAQGSPAAGLFSIRFTFETRLLTFPVRYLTTPIHPHFSLPFRFVPFVAL